MQSWPWLHAACKIEISTTQNDQQQEWHIIYILINFFNSNDNDSELKKRERDERYIIPTYTHISLRYKIYTSKHRSTNKIISTLQRFTKQQNRSRILYFPGKTFESDVMRTYIKQIRQFRQFHAYILFSSQSLRSTLVTWA